MRDAWHYLDWLDIHPGVCCRPVGIVGYCMGAALALRATSPHLPVERHWAAPLDLFGRTLHPRS